MLYLHALSSGDLMQRRPPPLIFQQRSHQLQDQRHLEVIDSAN